MCKCDIGIGMESESNVIYNIYNIDIYNFTNNNMLFRKHKINIHHHCNKQYQDKQQNRFDDNVPILKLL